MIKVAPLAGAWIEMWYAKYKNTSQLVAPLAGAWIEMNLDVLICSPESRRSPRGSVD